MLAESEISVFMNNAIMWMFYVGVIGFPIIMAAGWLLGVPDGPHIPTAETPTKVTPKSWKKMVERPIIAAVGFCGALVMASVWGAAIMAGFGILESSPLF